jgi:hypothetical protein
MDKSTIIAFILGSITTLLGSVAANIFNERRDRRKEFNGAASEFRAAFNEEIKGLTHHKTSMVWNIIRPEIIIKHEIAVNKFKFFVDKGKRIGFATAWRAYSEYEPKQKYEKESPGYTSEPWDIEEEKKMILQKINTLLSYAEYK